MLARAAHSGKRVVRSACACSRAGQARAYVAGNGALRIELPYAHAHSQWHTIPGAAVRAVRFGSGWLLLEHPGNGIMLESMRHRAAYNKRGGHGG